MSVSQFVETMERIAREGIVLVDPVALKAHRFSGEQYAAFGIADVRLLWLVARDMEHAARVIERLRGKDN